jgi:hypothetical protein
VGAADARALPLHLRPPAAGAALPLLRFSVRDSISKRLRSFGDLQNVPDVDNARCARAHARQPTLSVAHARATAHMAPHTPSG